MENHCLPWLSPLLLVGLSHCGGDPAGAGAGPEQPLPPLPPVVDGSADAPEPASSAEPPNQRPLETCDVLRTYTIAFDELTSLGFAPSKVLPFALGERTVQLEWLGKLLDEDGNLLDYVGESAVDVRIGVDLRGDTVRVSELGDAERGTRCEDRLEVDVGVTLETADGALREQVVTALELRQGRALFHAEIPAASLQGQHAFEPVDMGLELSAVHIRTVFTRHGLSGELSEVRGSGADATGWWSARWPVWAACNSRGLTPLQEDRDGVVGAALDIIRSMNPLSFVGVNGERAPAQLSLTAQPRSACYWPSGVVSLPYIGLDARDELNVIADLELTSAVLPAPLRFPIQVVGGFAPDSGSVLDAGLSFGSMRCSRAGYNSPQDFVASCGDWGVDFDGVAGAAVQVYEASFQPGAGYVRFRIKGLRGLGCTPGPKGLDCGEGKAELDVVTLGEASIEQD